MLLLVGGVPVAGLGCLTCSSRSAHARAYGGLNLLGTSACACGLLKQQHHWQSSQDALRLGQCSVTSSGVSRVQESRHSLPIERADVQWLTEISRGCPGWYFSLTV